MIKSDALLLSDIISGEEDLIDKDLVLKDTEERELTRLLLGITKEENKLTPEERFILYNNLISIKKQETIKKENDTIFFDRNLYWEVTEKKKIKNCHRSNC